MQFTMLLNDIGFAEGDAGGNGGNGGAGGAVTPDFVLYGTTAAQDVAFPDFVQDVSGPQTFGSGAIFDFAFADTTFNPVISVTAGEGFAPDVWVAFLAVNGYVAGFADGYDTLNVKVKGSPDGRVEVKLIGAPGEGTDSVVEVNVASYAGSTDLGDGWYQLSIPFSEFTNPGNIPLHNGWIVGPPGDQGDAAFVFLLTDVGFSDSAGGGNGGGDSDPTFVNGNFEDGLTGWTQTLDPDGVGDGVGTISADNSGQGGRAGTVARLVTNATATQFSNVVISQEGLAAGTVMPGDSIDVSFDLYGSQVGAGGVVFVEVIFLNGDGVDVGGRNFVADVSLPTPDTPYAPTETWTTYSGTVIAGTGWVGGPYDVSGGVVLSLKAACGPIDGCGVDASFDNVTFTIN
jgi:hypothetical protein